MSQNNSHQSTQKPHDAAAASVFHPVENKNKAGSTANASGTTNSSSGVAGAQQAVAKNPSNEATRQQEMDVRASHV